MHVHTHRQTGSLVGHSWVRKVVRAVPGDILMCSTMRACAYATLYPLPHQRFQPLPDPPGLARVDARNFVFFRKTLAIGRSRTGGECWIAAGLGARASRQLLYCSLRHYAAVQLHQQSACCQLARWGSPRRPTLCLPAPCA